MFPYGRIIVRNLDKREYLCGNRYDMKKNINTYTWRSGLKNLDKVESIDEDVILVDKSVASFGTKEPFKLNAVLVVVCIKGSASGKINLVPYIINGPCMMIMLTDQVHEYGDISDDFEGFFLVLSEGFSDSLNLHERFPLYASILHNPLIPLSEKDVDSLMDYHSMLQKTIRMTDNPYRLEVAKYLTKAFFYGNAYYFHDLDNNSEKDKQEMLVNNFIRLVEIHFKVHRGIEFYAKELCRTPKYMSSLIKKHSGFYAGEWINNRVALEAKALMSSTKMTIQQISNELNFPSQSSFSKYFKRLVGISPTQYRESRQFKR